jgi:hypothetical protein
MLEVSTISAMLLVVAMIAAFIAKISARNQIIKLKKMQEELTKIKSQVEEFNLFKNSFLNLFTPDVHSLIHELTKHAQSLEKVNSPDEQRKVGVCINSVSDRLKSLMTLITQLPNIDDDTSLRRRIKEQILSKPWHGEYLS